MDDISGQAAGIGALVDETRRALYEYVAGQTEPVSREQAATALDLAPSSAYFHLDRLVSEGLLEVEYRRLTGRTGPGAGRPSKLYRRADREFSVTLPPRRYALVGEILAEAIDRVAAGEALGSSLERSAHETGLGLGRSAAWRGDADELAAVADVLTGQGYEPHREPDVVTLANCPFDTLAKKHTELICGVNQSFVQGVTDGLGCTGVRACLEPEPGSCCVKLRSAQDA
jgi:predicted ArsR family transcriptional regulator